MPLCDGRDDDLGGGGAAQKLAVIALDVRALLAGGGQFGQAVDRRTDRDVSDREGVPGDEAALGEMRVEDRREWLALGDRLGDGGVVALVRRGADEAVEGRP